MIVTLCPTDKLSIIEIINTMLVSLFEVRQYNIHKIFLQCSTLSVRFFSQELQEIMHEKRAIHKSINKVYVFIF